MRQNDIHDAISLFELYDAISLFESYIDEAYEGRNRDVIEATGHLQCEASELAELFLKKKWYNKTFTDVELLSEAGDIINFLTFILREHDLGLKDAIRNNMVKLRERGYVL